MGLTGYQTMEGLQQRKDVKVLSDAKYRDLVKRKSKETDNCALVAESDPRSDTTCTTKRRQACSSKRVLMRKFRRRHGSTRLGGLTTYLVQCLVTQCFGMSVMEGREGAGNTDIRRYMIATRRKAYKALSELLEHADSDWAGNVIHELVKEYEGILAALNEGSALTLESGLVEFTVKASS